MSKLSKVLTTYGLVVGVASAVFMLYVFLNEAFFGRGILYYETNIAMATLEFFVALSGLVILGFLMITSIASDGKPQDLTERVGYETHNKKAYQ